MKKFIFIRNFGKYGKDEVIIWANDSNEAWELLGKQVDNVFDYLLTT